MSDAFRKSATSARNGFNEQERRFLSSRGRSWKIDITGRTEPSRLSFQIDGISDSVGGEGYFEASASGDGLTRLTGYLDISGKGAMGFMMNGVMKTFVPKTVDELTQAVADKLVEIHSVPS
ncbi:hypothetical protein [Paenibacillus humicus]|uniref:hypothetical protein n=1 Tax=Paenibacillus humicus TaxID=412861 RepID=UPI003F16CCAF